MARLLLTLRYVGTAYHGWQVQTNGVTVQQTVQDALESILGRRPGLTGCSRTDAGVHAREFCAHFDSDTAIPPQKLVMALNARLPADIGVTGCRPVPSDFHARYACRGKTYCYRVLNSRERDPFWAGRAWQVTQPFDLELLNRTAACFVGRHDFAGFCSAGSSVGDTVRTVSACHAERQGEIVSLYITADGFLYNMVRIIAGTLTDVQRGRIAAEKLPEIIDSRDRGRAGVTAPPCGLYLEKVFY